MGISGNEATDAAAKAALNNPVDTTVCIPYTDIKCKVTKYFKDKF